MSSTPSGIDSSRALSSLVDPPNRPETVALPPAKARAVEERRQPSPSRVSTAGSLSTIARRSTVPSAGQPDPAGDDVGDSVEDEVAAPGPGDPGSDLAAAAAKLAACVQAGDGQRSAAQPAGGQCALERSAGRIEQCDALKPAASDDDRRRTGEAGIVGLQVDRDSLEVVERAEHEPPGETAAVDVELSGEAAGIGAKRPGRPRARDVDRRDLDQRRLAFGEEDRSVRGEGAEMRSSGRPVGEAGGSRVEVEEDVAQPERLARPGEPDRQLRPLDPAVEAHRERAVGRLGALALEEEGAVAPPEAVARDPDLRRGEDEVAEVEDEVVVPRTRSASR